MFGAFYFGQGYFAQGAPGIVQALIRTIVALELVGTLGVPVDAYAAALAIALDTSAFYAPTVDLTAAVARDLDASAGYAPIVDLTGTVGDT